MIFAERFITCGFLLTNTGTSLRGPNGMSRQRREEPDSSSPPSSHRTESAGRDSGFPIPGREQFRLVRSISPQPWRTERREARWVPPQSAVMGWVCVADICPAVRRDSRVDPKRPTTEIWLFGFASLHAEPGTSEFRGSLGLPFDTPPAVGSESRPSIRLRFPQKDVTTKRVPYLPGQVACPSLA